KSATSSESSTSPASSEGAKAPNAALSAPSELSGFSGFFGLSELSGLLFFWSAGVVFFSVRLLGGWFLARRLALRAVRPAGAEIQALARRVAGRLALDRIVSIYVS